MSIDFEKIHRMFDGLMFDLCSECGGSCEKNTMCTLLPGEAEYVALKFGGGGATQPPPHDYCLQRP